MNMPWGPWPPPPAPVIPPPGPAPYTPGLPDLWNPPPTNTTEALDQLVTRACTDLFLDTTSGASGNVYITWAALWDVVLETTGAIRIWVVNTSITIPTGIYSFDLPDRAIELLAANDQGLCSVAFAAGAQFVNGPRVMRGMTLNANGSNAVLKVDSSMRIVATDTTFSGGGAHPVIDVQGGSTLDLAMDGALGAITNGGGTDTVVELGSGGGGTLVVQAVSSGDYTVGQSTVGGAGGGAGTLVLLTSPSASFSQVQAGLTAPPTFAQLSVATGVKFVPSTPGNWAIVPTEVGGALDGLASTVVGFVPSSRTVTAGAGLAGGGSLAANRTFNVGANADGSMIVNADDIQVGVLATDAQHGARGGGTQHAVVVAAGAAGFMSGADKTALNQLVAVGTIVQQTVLAADKTTTNVANPPATDIILSQTTSALPAGVTKLLIRAMCHASASTGARIYFAIYVDSVLKARDWIFADTVSGEGECNFEFLMTGLSAATHQIDLYWSLNTAGTAICKPVLNPELYRCTITSQAFA